MMPALLTKTSIGPSCSSVASRNWRIDSRSVTLTGSAIAAGPSSAAVFFAVSRSRSPIATFMPSRMNASAVARPIPRAAPVMAAT